MGAPRGNRNAAGPHKRGGGKKGIKRTSNVDSYTKWLVGQHNKGGRVTIAKYYQTAPKHAQEYIRTHARMRFT